MFNLFRSDRSNVSKEPLLVRRLDGTPVDVDLSRAYSVKDVREKIAVALAVDTQPYVGIKFLNGGCDICDDTALETIDRDLGLSVVLVQGAPEWYPREKYMYDDQEVLQITRTGDECFAEFVNGSSQRVDLAVYQKALQEWSWQEVSHENRFWAHPGEKPKESGGWTDFMASMLTKKNAARGFGAATGFLAGVTGNTDCNISGQGDFSNSFVIAQMVGLLVYGAFQIVQLVRK